MEETYWRSGVKENLSMKHSFTFIFILLFYLFRASLTAQSAKNLPAMQETRVRFLGLEDPMEKEMTTHSSISAWKIPWTEESGKLLSTRSQESDMTATKPPPFLHLFF